MALLIRKQKKIFPDITDRIGIKPQKPTRNIESSGTLSAAVEAVAASAIDSLSEAFYWLYNKVNLTPEAAASAYFNGMPRKIFETFKKYGYLLVVEPATIIGGAVILITYGGVEYIIKPVFSTLIEGFRKIKAKGVFGSLISAFSKKPEILHMIPEDIFDSLPETIRRDLLSIGYSRTSPEFVALVGALGHGIHRCDEEDCIKSLTSGHDRFSLKTKLEGILKKLELNAEDEFLKFQKKVVDILNNRFSLFAKFQQMVIDELYKIGSPQIPEITPDFFQILDPEQHEADLKEMQELYNEFNYDQIKT
jgi:regulator of sigma D